MKKVALLLLSTLLLTACSIPLKIISLNPLTQHLQLPLQKLPLKLPLNLI